MSLHIIAHCIGDHCVTQMQWGTTEWIPRVAPTIRPQIGMKFVSLENTEKFYVEYARQCGLDVRLSTSRKDSFGRIISRYSVCSKEGFKRQRRATFNSQPSNGCV